MSSTVHPCPTARTSDPAARASHPPRRHPAVVLVLAAITLAFFVFNVCPAAATPPPSLLLHGEAIPTNLAPGNKGSLVLLGTDIGSTPTDGTPITVTATLPEGLTYVGTSEGPESNNEVWAEQESEGGVSCAAAAGVVTCTVQAGPLPGDGEAGFCVDLWVEAATGSEGTLPVDVRVEGGGSAPATTVVPLTVSAEPAPFGLASFLFDASDADGVPSTQAGAHPNGLFTGFDLTSTQSTFPDEPYLAEVPSLPKDVVTELPLGLLGNPQAAGVCPQAKVITLNGTLCPPGARLGVSILGSAEYATYKASTGGSTGLSFVNNTEPDVGFPAEFGLGLSNIAGPIYSQVVHTPSGYVLRTVVPNIPHPAKIRSAFLALLGDPDERNGVGTPRPFFTMPSDCSAAGLHATIHVDSWADPAPLAIEPDGLDDFEGANFSEPQWITRTVPFPTPTGCEKLRFEPTLEARPSTTAAESPSGLNVDLKVPQNEEPEGLATPPLKDATVTLPPGIAVDPSSAAGLEGCGPLQIELESTRPGGCPDASKLGTVELKTPLLEKELPGAVYLGTPECAPCSNADAASGRLIRLYLEIDDPERGVVIKLPGSATTDPATGQLAATFAQNPQLPFEELKVTLFKGERASLTTPSSCGSYETTSSLTPWSAPQSGPPATPSDHWSISAGAGGAACTSSESQLPNKPSFSAGTQGTQAGAFAPFVLNLSRPDGSQRLKALDVTLPPGLTGRLAGVAECSDAAIAAADHSGGAQQKADPSCPQSSELGTVDVAAGSGATPFHVQGHAYLAGPYKGAPLSMAIVTPAVAGPFDLGTVVVRSALFVDPFTTQITVKSDPIPQILAGIPLDLRSISVDISRNQFTINPTSCEKFSLTAIAFGSSSEAALSNPFQVGGCGSLGFKPKLAISLSGSTKHAGHPGLKAVLTMPEGQTDISRAQVNLPHSEFIDQANLDKTCTRPVLLEGKCPTKSIYGHAKAWTPLLEKPLEGPVYLVGGFGFKLPALVAELDGQIKVLLVGKVDSGKNHGIRNTFEAVPDAPVSRFVLEMKGGKKYSLLENSEDICARPQKAQVSFSAQNGAVDNFVTPVANDCGKGKGRRKGKGHKSGKAHR
jgi:hypothetical protein